MPAGQAPGLLLHPPLPPDAAGNWVCLRLSAGAGAGPWWAKLSLADAAREQIVREAFLGPARRRGRTVWRETLLHVPVEAGTLTVEIFGDVPRGLTPDMQSLSRTAAAALLLRHGWRALPAAMRGDRRGLAGRVRAMLGQAPARRGEAPPYAAWLRWYETPTQDDHEPRLPVLVLGDLEAGEAARLAQIAAGVRRRLPDGAWPVAPGEWIVLLAPNDRLAAGALRTMACHIGPDTDFVYADTDTVNAAGERCDPVFKPGPGPALLRSGLLTTGACMVRWPQPAPNLPAGPEAAKLALALHAGTRISRIAAILTHRLGPIDNPRALMPVVERSLVQHGLTASIAAGDRYVRVQRRPTAKLPLLSVVVPSACRAGHVVRCLRRVVETTRDVDLEIIVAASCVDTADRRQAAILAELETLPRLRVLRQPEPVFNYAAVNNCAVTSARGELLLLLNDDVSPFASGWLPAMLAQFEESDIGAVGARLLYGNGLVQHNGVILGLAHLCEHGDRLRSRDAPGPFGISRLDREISAVTAACMAVRASAFAAVGGLDPGFAIALNDVDFCLKLRRAGWRIVQCATVDLAHFESLSLGRHYGGGRAQLEAVEVRRLRDRWRVALSDDPYYNPQADLQPGREWLPAFPPRKPCFSATPRNSFAKD